MLLDGPTYAPLGTTSIICIVEKIYQIKNVKYEIWLLGGHIS
jgi:hypothetical protein